MATTKPLLILKVTALRSLAVSLGVNSSGTKSQIASRIVGACCESVPFFERSQEDVPRSNRRATRGKALGIGIGKAPKGGRKKRVLSIDMGIRNLAMCILEVPHYGSRGVGEKGEKERVMESFPRILAWERVVVAEKPVTEKPATEEKPPPPPPTESISGPNETDNKMAEEETAKAQFEELLPAQPVNEIPGSNEIGKKRRRKAKKSLFEELESLLSNPYSAPDIGPYPEEPGKKAGRTKLRKVKKQVESFEPSLYAILANSFARQLLARFSPLDAILIERQRYRSNSGAAIHEWTVRVNMFEAMLHAVFCCLNGEASPAAESVNPDRVTRFWVDRVGEKYLKVQRKPVRRKKSDLGVFDIDGDLDLDGIVMVGGREKSYRKTKLAKISLVTEWLRRGDVVDVGEDAKGVAADFIPPAKGRRKVKSVNGKLDDLADCFLQGMAWIRWEENRKNLADGKLIPEFMPCKNLDS